MNFTASFDDFLPVNLARYYRMSGIGVHYPEPGVQHGGATYPGMSLTMDTEFEDEMKPRLAEALGVTDVTFTASFFRSMLEGQNTGHGHKFRVHYDSVFASYACVLYLSERRFEAGGTAFWNHKTTGANAVTAKNEERLAADLTDQAAWTFESLIGMRYNRLAVYPANRIHSAFPNYGWNTDRKHARLIWAGLFDAQGAPSLSTR